MQGRGSIVWRVLSKYRSHSSLKAGLMWGLLALLIGLPLLLAQEGLAKERQEVIVEAVKYRVKGYIYQRQGKLDEAVKFYKKAIQHNPFYACAHNDLGIVYEQKGMLDRAEKQYLKALELDPNYIVVHTNLALLYERTGELKKACHHWEKRAALGDPTDRWTLRAKERFTHLSLTLAEEEKLERVAEEEEELAKREKELVKQLKEVKKPEVPAKELTSEELQKEAALDLADEIAAAKRLEKSRRLTQADQIYQMGLRFYRQGRHEEAIEQFQEVMDLLPEHKEAKRYLGKALDSIEAQRKEREGRIDLYYNKGVDYFASKKYDLALKEFLRVKELDPNYPDIDRLIQETQDARDRAPAEEEARRRRDKLQRQNEKLLRQGEKLQKKVGYYFRKGEDYFASKKYKLALKKFRKVKELDPNYPDIDSLIREAQQAIDRTRIRPEPKARVEPAKKDRQIAKKDRQIEREVRRHFKKGESYYMAGKYQKAVGEFEQVLTLDPSHYDANRLLRYCRRRLQPREFGPLAQAEPATLPVAPPEIEADVELTRPRVKPSEIPTVLPGFLPEKAKVSTTDLKENYDILGVVAHRAKKGELEEVNVELEKKAKAIGGDYVIQTRYFEYEDYLYGYGTAVKLKR